MVRHPKSARVGDVGIGEAGPSLRLCQGLNGSLIELYLGGDFFPLRRNDLGSHILKCLEACKSFEIKRGGLMLPEEVEAFCRK